MAGTRLRRRCGALLAVFVVVAAVLSGCRGPFGGAGDDAIDWHPCGTDDGVDASAIPADVAARLSCGRLAVPMDATRPRLGTVSVVIARLVAAGRRSGTLLVDPGGPGGSGVAHLAAAAASLAAEPIAASYDLVGVDWRGVGASRPSLRCRTDGERDAERGMDLGDRTLAGIALVEEFYRDLAARCRARVGAAFLARAGTDYVVGDIDRVRVALGENTIGFLGYSYGSRVGIEYARRFGRHVQALILDGVVDPAESPVDASLAQLAGFGHAFDAFATDCAARGDCPLGDRGADAVRRYRSLVDPLLRRPVAVGARSLTASDAETGTVFALYEQSRWPQLRGALADLSRGRGEALLRLADSLEGRDVAGHYDGSQDALLAIGCADDARTPDRRRYDMFDTAARRVAQFRDDGRGTGRAPLGVCEFWTPAAPDPDGAGSSAPVVPPTLVVSTRGDPATPYATGVRMASRLRAALVTVPANSHTAVFRGDACVDRAVDGFLRHPTAPRRVLTC
ncbi:alpha/beta hydrolase [Gordonia sp. NPDC003424]